MGLLDKARRNTGSETTVSEPTSDPRLKKKSFHAKDERDQSGILKKKSDQILVEQLVNNLAAYHRDLSFPLPVFRAIVDSIDLDAAAFLFADAPGGYYIPVASVGFDVTSRRRMHIPLQLLDQNHRLLDGCYMHVGRDGLTFLEQFFSIREYGMLEEIVFVPFNHEGTPFAVLLIAYHIEHTRSIEREADLAQQIAQSLSKDLYEARVRKMHNLPVHEEDEADTGIADLVSRADRDQMRLLTAIFSLAGLIESIVPDHEFADTYLFRTDLLRIFKSFISSNGCLVSLGDDTFVLCILTRSVSDEHFILYHIGLSLQRFYSRSLDFPLVVDTVLYYPDDVSSVDELFSKLGVEREQ